MGQNDFLRPSKFLYLHAGRFAQNDALADLEGRLAPSVLHMDMHGEVVVAVEEESESFDGEEGRHVEMTDGWTGTPVPRSSTVLRGGRRAT